MATNAEARALQFMRNIVEGVRARVEKMPYDIMVHCHACNISEKRDIFLSATYHYPHCDFMHMVDIVNEADAALDTTPDANT